MCYTNPSRAGAAGTERYRSGHNGADSKSVCAKAHKGSNPFLSATKSTVIYYGGLFYATKCSIITFDYFGT